MTVTVTITSDFICPWCLIGERRLAKAIRALPSDVTFDIKWRPFELNPTMPSEGMDRRIYRTAKFGSWERSQMLDAQTTEAARDDDIAFDYAAIKKTPNTFLAHRLMRLAEQRGVATGVANAIFAAYFEQGRDIGNVETLADIATESGLDRSEVRALCQSDESEIETRAAENAQYAAGIHSVPHFSINGHIVSGAQSVETFEAILRRAIERTDAHASGISSNT